MIRHIFTVMVICSFVLYFSGCMSNAERVQSFKDQQQARSDKLVVQARKNKRAAQDKVYASNAEKLIRTCANTSEATIRNEGKLLTQCQSINLLPGKWKGDFELGGNKFTIELNITNLNGSGVEEDVPTPYLIFPTKVDVVSQDSPNDLNRKIVTLLSGDYSVTYFPDARFLRLNIDDDHAPSAKSYLGLLDMGLARLEGDNYFTGNVKVAGEYESDGKSYSFDYKSKINLKPVSPQAMRIPPVNFDALLDLMMRSSLWTSYESLAYLIERLDSRLGDDLEKRRQLANKLFAWSRSNTGCAHCNYVAFKNYVYVLEKLGDDIEKRLEVARLLDELRCSECRSAALKNYLFIAGKTVDVRLYLRISKMYKDGLGTQKNDTEALRWKSMAEKVFAQALDVCKSKAEPLMNHYVFAKYPKSEIVNLGIALAYHKEPELENLGIRLDYYKEAQLINMSKAFVCSYTIRYEHKMDLGEIFDMFHCEDDEKDYFGNCEIPSNERFANYTITIEPEDQKNDTVYIK